MPTTNDSSEIQYLWATPILVRSNDEHTLIQADLLELFYQHRHQHEKKQQPIFASRDNLHILYKDHPAFAKLIKFILDSVFELAADVNGPHWQRAQNIDVHLTGVWFQMSNGYGFHETHVHGNCSWSGVYYVQAGESGRSATDKKDGLINGVTRFYGPYMEYSAGGHAEFGNLYLQYHTWDSFPEDGKIAVFPSYLKHMVFPYQGKRDRVVVSFHAQVHGEKDLRYGYEFN
ncbi:MAG: 2OG-Fe(II) oxygenase family protein [Gammaproteobacteria bacterium]|nr:2OG-Fe(II) oxygenase family protein [Gammaproteobacteria bacterium]MDH3468375.1 2OG-Fe(II) oxygenase family protein [Gammaproteobacteria bacterium]